MKLPADYRLAFRELGLAIGLQAIERLHELTEQYPEVFREESLVRSHLQSLMRYGRLKESIDTFWLESKNRESGTWADHLAINMVMLATSLSPDGYLSPL